MKNTSRIGIFIAVLSLFALASSICHAGGMGSMAAENAMGSAFQEGEEDMNETAGDTIQQEIDQPAPAQSEVTISPAVEKEMEQ